MRTWQDGTRDKRDSVVQLLRADRTQTEISGENDMNIDELKLRAENLEERISSAQAETRIALQPQFSSVLGMMAAEGAQVPVRMRRLDAALVDEAIEARFDNMPV